MALLFYGGIMNLLWIIGLAFYVLIEKVLPVNIKVANYSGMILIAWGILLL
jgi:predicted metal-binding membrane protein